MNESILAQLNDIQTPEPVGVWPLAWGWWLIIAIVLILIAFTIYFIRQHIRLNKAKKQALKLLSDAQHLSPDDKVKSINQILKRVTLAYAPREAIAGLTGEQWAKWLNQFDNKAQISPALLSLTYQGQTTTQQAEEYFQQAKRWVTKVLPLTQRQLEKITNTSLETNEVSHNV
ncbi:MAG: DUF4381 domain-containing protein [Gammaproteobacteria bacterium]|nr:DUF4381 domain-containing protein [Gammaproteobacteria bacterium]